MRRKEVVHKIENFATALIATLSTFARRPLSGTSSASANAAMGNMISLDMVQKACTAYCALKLLQALRTAAKQEHALYLPAPRPALDAAHFPTKFVNAQGLLLQTRAWLPRDTAKLPRALVFLVHGYGEHLGRYEHVAAALTGLGFAVFGVDHQGHGASEGDRAHVGRFDHFAEDVLAHAAAVLQGAGGAAAGQGGQQHSAPFVAAGDARGGVAWRALPRFLVGHSMGGAITLRAAELSASAPAHAAQFAHAWRGVVLSAPMLLINPAEATALNRFLAGALASVLPKLGINPHLAGTAVSRDSGVQASYDNDPLVYGGRTRVNFGNEAIGVCDRLLASTPAFALPFLILTGDEDTLCMPEGADRFYRLAGSADKTMKHYPACRHEIFNEPERDIVIKDVTDWLEKHL